MVHFFQRHSQGNKVKRIVPVSQWFQLTRGGANMARATASKDSSTGFSVLAMI
jgi:hypothetical protein